MASKRKKPSLPTTYSGAEPVSIKSDPAYEARERKYKAEEGLRTLQRADEVRRDKSLMKDIKSLAKQQLKACE